LPAEILKLSPLNKHAIAVDASRARLYLFQNLPDGPKLVADYYISVGKLGIDKEAEGDLRTPLGVYFITSQLDPRTLKDFYGIGALPINYPNMLDLRRGKTGKGIWLHGTPPGQFSRPPQDSDGCIVLANPDLERILKTVEIRSTPVIIARQLNWIPQLSTRVLSLQFEALLARWVAAKSTGNTDTLATFYSPDFSQNGRSLDRVVAAFTARGACHSVAAYRRSRT
jgi:murein L,D-transpeptidase YafK